MRENERFDVVCVGAGAVGLLVAHDLADRGAKVALLDQSMTGREASWAGAGIIPPAFIDHAKTPYARLRAVSFERFGELAAEILSNTGIDIGYRRTGGIEVARTTEERNTLINARPARHALGVAVESLNQDQLRELEPGMSATEAEWLPEMCQIRNPRLLMGLAVRCRQLGVTILEHTPVVDFVSHTNKIDAVRTKNGNLLGGDHFVVTAGAWSGELLKRVGQNVPIHPVQGQIIVYETSGNDAHHIILEGKRYLVPRDDGLLLVGATEEEIGFAKQVTDDALESLRAFACELFPSLTHSKVRHAWAGLRPGNKLGHPIIGLLPNWKNLWLATGHFRHGLQQSPGTARLIADWITNQRSFAEPADFAIDTPAEFFASEFQS